jgi:hypothetical protein
MKISTVGFDADHTLRHDERVLRLTEERLGALLAFPSSFCPTPARLSKPLPPAALPHDRRSRRRPRTFEELGKRHLVVPPLRPTSF